MANTFTDNYNFVKSEIGGDNQSWGNNLHTTLSLADFALAKAVENQLMSGITNAAIIITAGSGTGGVISTATNLKYFESVVIGDKVRISTSSTVNAANGTPTVPVIYTVTGKTSADSITVNTQMVTDSASTVTIAKVLEPVHINSGPIICAPLANLSAATRTAGGTAVPGDDATSALVANGNVTLGASNANTVTVTAKVASDLIPSVDDNHNLGSSTLSWDDLYAKGTSTLTNVAIAAGTIAGITVTSSGSAAGSGHKTVNLAVTGQSGSFTNFNIGSNGQGAKTVSTSAPSATTGYANGDVWYEIP